MRNALSNASQSIAPGAALFRRFLLGASALAGTSLALSTVQADAQTVAAGDSSNTLAEIVVTAERREERLQDVPVAVTAISAAELAAAHIDDASRLELLTPGFVWGQQGSDSFPAIRGVRTSLVSAQNDPVIGFYIDGVYQSRTQQQSIPLFDEDRVEVQRGPQGTLYGRNTFGGNISVVTQEPLKTFGGYLDAEYGNYNAVKVDGAVNIPLSDTLQLRVAGVHISHDGYVRSTHPGVTLDDQDENAGRISLKWTPTNRLEVLLHAGEWIRMDNGSGSYGYKVAGTLINPNTGYQSINGAPFAVNPSVTNTPLSEVVHGVNIGVPVTGGPWTNDWDYQPFEHVVENYVSGVISYDLDVATLRSISGYTRFRAHRSADNDQSSVIFSEPAQGFGSGVQEPDTIDGTFSEEIQLASKASKPFQWIVGAYYLHDDIKETYQQDILPASLGVDGYKETTGLQTNAYAAYAQAPTSSCRIRCASSAACAIRWSPRSSVSPTMPTALLGPSTSPPPTA